MAAHRARQRAQADARQADHADQLSDRLDLDQEQPMSEGHYRPADFYKPKADAPPRPRPVGHFRPADFYKPKAAERDDPAA